MKEMFAYMFPLMPLFYIDPGTGGMLFQSLLLTSCCPLAFIIGGIIIGIKKKSPPVILGFISIAAFILPLAGIPMSIAGIIVSALAINKPDSQQTALAGLILSIIGLLLAIGNSILGFIYLPELLN